MKDFIKQNKLAFASLALCLVLLFVSVAFLVRFYLDEDAERTEASEWTEGELPSSINIVDTSKAEYSYDEMRDDLLALQSEFGGLMSVRSAGLSHDGREIYYAVVGAPDASRQILINAGIHGREYLTPLLVMKQLEHILQYYNEASYNGVLYSALLRDCELYFVPMVNPDGIMISQEGLGAIRSEELRRGIEQIYASDCAEYSSYNNYGSIENYLKAWKANAVGVDINRNFAIDEWTEVSNTIGQPSSQKYKGAQACSEPETRAMVSLIESLDRLVGCISYHSQGEIIYWDSGQSGAVRDKTFFLKNALCRESGYTCQESFTSLDGTLDDWCLLNKKIPTVTVETGYGKCPLPISDFEEIWKKNYRGPLIAAEILR